jgi:molybdenum cofactor cytidylyltransferase
MRVAAIVLAAGLSTRMGKNKLLEPIGGEPLIARVVRRVESSRADPIFVVLGNQGIEINSVLPLPRIKTGTVFDGSTRDGIGVSISVGMRVLPVDCAGTFIVLGDMPSISPEILNKMIDVFEAGDANTICVPIRGGMQGNPVLFGSAYFSDLSNLDGDAGARSIVAANSRHVCEVAADDDGVLVDIDTPEELEAFRRRDA